VASDPRYETREVLAVAYSDLRRAPRLLTHTVRVTGPGEGDYVLLCRRVKHDSIADGGANPPGLGEPPTCPACLRNDPRFREAAHHG
jgi:hypothetical protein